VVVNGAEKAAEAALWGKKYRPYALRHWFKHAVVNAEADGFVPSVWGIFWFGHSGTIESVYSTQGLADKDVEKMRECYRKASETHLSTSERPSSRRCRRSGRPFRTRL
jgi:hypothetical protein